MVARAEAVAILVAEAVAATPSVRRMPLGVQLDGRDRVDPRRSAAQLEAPARRGAKGPAARRQRSRGATPEVTRRDVRGPAARPGRFAARGAPRTSSAARVPQRGRGDFRPDRAVRQYFCPAASPLVRAVAAPSPRSLGLAALAPPPSPLVRAVAAASPRSLGLAPPPRPTALSVHPRRRSGDPRPAAILAAYPRRRREASGPRGLALGRRSLPRGFRLVRDPRARTGGTRHVAIPPRGDSGARLAREVVVSFHERVLDRRRRRRHPRRRRRRHLRHVQERRRLGQGRGGTREGEDVGARHRVVEDLLPRDRRGVRNERAV